MCRDVSALGRGRIAYGPLCDADGKMVDDCTVMPRSADGDHVRFCGANDLDYEIFAAAADGLGIDVRERTDELPHLCLQGPKSRAILQGMTTSDLSSQAFPYYTFREDVEVAGIPVFMTRLGYTAELGYELWVDGDRALDLWDVRQEGTAGLAAWIAARRVTVYHSTPSVFRAFTDALSETGRPPARWTPHISAALRASIRMSRRPRRALS